MWPGPGIAAHTRLIVLVRLPVNESLMMITNEHLPFLLWQVSHAVPHPSSAINTALGARFAECIYTGIHRVREYLVDLPVSSFHEAGLSCSSWLNRKRQALCAKPEPNLPDRAH